MCSIDFDNPWRVWTNAPRIARKAYQCSGCGLPISHGDPYLAHKHIDGDGGFNSAKACFACWWTLEKFSEAHHIGTMPEALAELLRECLDGDGRDSEWRTDYAALLKRQRTAKAISAPSVKP